MPSKQHSIRKGRATKVRRRSRDYYARAQKSLAGGVSSPFRRSFPVVLYFRDGNGAVIKDVDGNSYLDYVLAWGPLILGHKHPALVRALSSASKRPHNYGAQHELEFLVAEAICKMVPCAERVALTSSGSEAVNLLPSSTWLATVNEPPWLSMIL